MLHELQKDFAAVALVNDAAALVPKVRASRGTRERRLGVYHNNTVISLTDVLKSAFPVVERIVGERFFQSAALAFIETYPPRRPTLFQYGGELPRFLGKFSPAKALPYLPDVARLEWARTESYFAADAESLNPDRLAEIPPDRLGGIAFKVHPSVRLIESPFPVFEVWAVNQPEHESVPEINFGLGEKGLVLRRGQTVVQRPMTAGAIGWLEAVIKGVLLGPAVETAMAIDETFDLQDTLRLLLADGTFTDLRI